MLGLTEFIEEDGIHCYCDDCYDCDALNRAAFIRFVFLVSPVNLGRIKSMITCVLLDGVNFH